MMKHNIGILFCASVIMALAACGGDEVSWPDKPADGAPVVVQFVKMQGTGDDRSADMRVFNFTDKSVTRMQMTLSYLDAEGNKLGEFPWSQHDMAGLVGSKAHAVKKMGSLIKEGTTKVTADLLEVEFRDGTSWKQK